MYRAVHKLRLFVQIMACLWAVCFWVGCADDDPGRSGVIYPGREDAGAVDAAGDAADAGDVDAPGDDERCDGRQTGARCEFANGSGVCVEGRCQFLSCESGYRDCDDDPANGCEGDVTTDAQCGGCGVSCADAETCQLSGVGFVCSASPVCTDGRYDLDGDLENGCEWAASWGEEGLFEPVSVEPHIADRLSSGAFAVAGRTQDARLVTATDANGAAEPLALEVDDAVDARGLVELRDADDTSMVAVAWNDAVTLSEASGSSADDGVFRYGCEDASGETPRSFRALAGADSRLFAATTHEVLALDVGSTCGERKLCAEPSAVFSTADYAEAYGDETTASACTACLPDASCPRFRTLGLDYLAGVGKLVVVTERGFFVLDSAAEGFAAGPRLEFGENEQERARYVAGTAIERDGEARIFLIDSDGILRRFRVELSGSNGIVEPAGPDVGLLMDTRRGVELWPAADGTLLVADARDVWLVRPTHRSARVEQLPEPEVFLGDGRIVVGAGLTAQPAEEFSALYFGMGRYYVRHMRR